MDPQRLVLVALLAAGISACVGDIDFDAIEPNCQEPNLDSAARDEFCSVLVGGAGQLALPEGEVAMGAHARGDAVVLATLANPEFYEDDSQRSWFSRELHVYWLNADDISDLDLVSHEDQGHVEVDVALAATAFDTRVIAERGGVVGLGLLNDFFFVQTDGGQVHRNLAGIRYPKGSLPFGDEVLGTLAYDLDAIEHETELMVVSALSFSGLKVQRFVWEDGAWSEELPTDIALPGDFRNGAPLARHGYELNCRGMSASNQVSNAEWRRECRDRCPKCSLADVVDDECETCRLADSFALPMGIGAFSAASLPDLDLFFVGGLDIYPYPASVLDPANWGELEYEANNTIDDVGATQISGYLGQPIALLDYTLSGEFSPTRVALAMHATRDRLYVVAGDISDEGKEDGLDLLVFAHDDGVIDTEILALFALPDELSVGLYVALAVQENSIVTVRSFKTDDRGFHEAGLVSYDMLDAEAPVRIELNMVDNDEEYGTHGLAALPDQLLIPTATGVERRNSQASGDRLP
jgi:hypothetical protein